MKYVKNNEKTLQNKLDILEKNTHLENMMIEINDDFINDKKSVIKKPILKYNKKALPNLKFLWRQRKKQTKNWKFTHFKLIKNGIKLNNKSIIKIDKKGSSSIVIVFSNLTPKEFVDIFSNNLQYNAFIPYITISYKGTYYVCR